MIQESGKRGRKTARYLFKKGQTMLYYQKYWSREVLPSAD